MANFYYTALDKKDALTKGQIEAKNIKKAKAILEGEGFMLINMVRVKKSRWQKFNNLFDNITLLDKIFFTRHLYTMLESGIALDQAVKITAEQVTNEKFREVLRDIHQRLQKGEAFYSCLSHHRKYFSNFYISIVKVGEKSGKLDEVLSYLLEQQESDYELITKTRSAMIYPSIIICALVVMVIFMMVFVIPKVTGILTEYDVQLPLATRILIGLSNFLINWGLLLIPVIGLIIYLLRRWIKTPKGKWRWDAFLLKIPRFNRIIIEFNLARLTLSASALLKSGVSIDKAIALAADVSNHSHYKKSLEESIHFVRRGVSFGEVLKGKPKLYPPICVRMIEIGEKAGKLDHMLHRLAIFYQKSVTTTVTNLTSVIEPFLLLLIGLSVAFVAVSVLTPIWKFSETV